MCFFLFTSYIIIFESFTARDPAAIERSNLVNICKLVVKELLEQSLRFGRMLDSDHLPLQHFLIVLEHVLRHGLKPKKVNCNITLKTAMFINRNLKVP